MDRKIRHIAALPHSYGKYELLERIGTGGMAEVYKARMAGVRGFEKTVVIKRLRPKHANDEGLARLFIEEAKLAAQVQHRNIVQVYELGELDHGELYIAMEYVPGTDLRKLIEHSVRSERPVPPWLAVHFVLEVLEALAYAHASTDEQGTPRNLVHCDVTPENIFLSRAGDVKLGDFGVATDDTRHDAPLADQVKGKLPYMSPEQVLGHTVDARTDVFSCAVVLWESLAGRRLFPGKTPSEVMAQICASPRPAPSRFCPAVPDLLDRVVLRALDPELSVRFQNASELCRDLTAVLGTMRSNVSTDEVRSELARILDAPLIRPDAPVFEQEQEEDHDELEALDRRHESPPAVPPKKRTHSGAVSRPASSVVHHPRSRLSSEPARDGTRPPSRSQLHEDLTAPPLKDVAQKVKPLSIYASESATARVPNLQKDVSTPRPALSGNPTPDARSITPTRPNVRGPRSPDDGPTYRLIRGQQDANEIMMAYLSEEDVFLREQVTRPRSNSTPASPFATSSAILTGAVPFFCRTADADVQGPLSPAKVLDLLHAHERRRRSRLTVSTNRQRWLRATEIADLLGEPLIRGHASAETVPVADGDLAEHSFVDVIGGLARRQATGRLALWTERGHEYEEIQFDLVDGALTHVAWTGAPFEVWRTVFDDPGLGADGLPEAFSHGLSSISPVVPRLPASAAHRIVEIRDALARRRFEAAVTWDRGGYSFDPQAPAPVAERGQSILRMLPSMTYRALSSSEIHRRLSPRLSRRHQWGADFAGVREELGLTEHAAQSLAGLAGTEPLGSAALRVQGQGDDKFVWVMAYLLTELGVLASA